MERYSQRANAPEVLNNNSSSNQESLEYEMARSSLTQNQPQQLQQHDQTNCNITSTHQGAPSPHQAHVNPHKCNTLQVEGRHLNAAHQSPSPLNEQYDYEADTGPDQSHSVDNQPPYHKFSRTGEERTQGDDDTKEKDDYHFDDEEIQKDAADEMVAIVVHIALGFFVLLFFGALVAAIIIVGKYGFLTFVLVASLMMTAVTIGYFVSRMLDQDKVLRPVRRKIRRWHAVATAVVVQEIRDFQLDLNEHLLLTNGDGDGDADAHEDGFYNMMDDHGQVGGSAASETKTKRTRSKIFGILVKPFLKKKKGYKFRFGRKKKNAETNEQIPVDGDHEMV